MTRFVAAAAILLALAGFGCAKKAQPLSAADTPAQHYLLGMRLLDAAVENRADLDRAGAEFDRALQLDPNFGPAWSGLSLTYAMRATTGLDAIHGQADAEKAEEALDKAKAKSRKGAAKFVYNVTSIRVLSLLRPSRWLEKCETAYKDALRYDDASAMTLPYYRDQGAAHVFLGQALILAGEYKEAQQILALGVGEPSAWNSRASELFAKAQKIERAQAQYSLTGLARTIAAKDRVVRADAAALIANELDPDRLFSGGPLVKAEPGAMGYVPVDVENHPMRAAIMTVSAWRVRGLEPLYDEQHRAYLFLPDKPVTRKELAFVIEDVVIRATGDASLATRFFSDADSPFPDVPVTAPWYNAAVTAIGRGLMQPDLSGAFLPEAHVDGADLVLTVLKLKQAVAR